MERSRLTIFGCGTADYVIAHAARQRKRDRRLAATYKYERNPEKALALALRDKAREPLFLYPISRQFSFDWVCERIVRELELRNWQVPGVEVEFDVYGKGESRFRKVSCIRGEDFKIRFGRVQGSLNRTYNNSAAVSVINIPGKELHVYEDESGPSFYLYVGGDWQKDKNEFMNLCKVNSKLWGKPRMYLKYKGTCRCDQSAGAAFEAVGFLTAWISGDGEKIAQMGHSHQGCRAPLLVHDNDIGREYSPEGDEPMEFVTSEVFEEFRAWMDEHVLGRILNFPLADNICVFPVPKETPFPVFAESLYTCCGWRDGDRIKQGKKDPSQLRAEDRYGLQGSGRRLLNLGVRNDGSFPKEAYDGFEWCVIGGDVSPEGFDKLEMDGVFFYSSDREYLVRVIPKTADGVFVADMGNQNAYKERIFADNPEQDQLTDGQYEEMLRIPARTLVPITEYQGGYAKPVVLINRELDFDEVEIVGNLRRAS